MLGIQGLGFRVVGGPFYKQIPRTRIIRFVGSILGSPYVGKLPCIGRHTVDGGNLAPLGIPKVLYLPLLGLHRMVQDFLDPK